MKIRLAKDSQLPENCLLNETELNSLKLERNASMGDYCSFAGSLHLLDRAQVGPFCTIDGTLKIGSDAAMEAHCLVRGSVFVGPRATIGSRCSAPSLAISPRLSSASFQPENRDSSGPAGWFNLADFVLVSKIRRSTSSAAPSSFRVAPGVLAQRFKQQGIRSRILR